MRCIAANGKNILVKYCLDMNQCSLVLAIIPVLEGGKQAENMIGLAARIFYVLSISSEIQSVMFDLARRQ